jgi:hypothetical protein
MKAYLIDPWSCTITEVERTADYRDVYRHLTNLEEDDIVTLMDAIRLDDGDAIMVDDEGLFKPAPMWSLMPPFNPIEIRGRGLVCGSDSEGNCANVKIGLDALKKMVGFAIVPGLRMYSNAA